MPGPKPNPADSHMAQKTMKPVALTVVVEPEPGTRAVIDRRSESSIAYRGRENGNTYVCGSCAAPLIVGLDIGKFHGVVIKCSHCKSFNAV